MSRIPPSQRVREEIQRLLQDGLSGDEDISSALLRLGAQRLAQELLEEEVANFLGRECHVRRDPAAPHRGYRNGYEPGRIPVLGRPYESLRLQGGPAAGLLCVWAILADGRKVLLHLTLGNKESYDCWLAMVRDMIRRGLRPAGERHQRWSAGVVAGDRGDLAAWPAVPVLGA